MYYELSLTLSQAKIFIKKAYHITNGKAKHNDEWNVYSKSNLHSKEIKTKSIKKVLTHKWANQQSQIQSKVHQSIY